MSKQTRRTFIRESNAAVATGMILASQSVSAEPKPADRVRVGIMGAGGRALSLIGTFASNPNVEVVAIADLDASRLPRGLRLAEKHQGRTPRSESDFRKLIEDRTIDALVIGAPDHWHAIPTILACQAGKDVYVEKPDGHDIVEGMRMVAAMRKYNRIVQMGSQQRSTARMQAALDFVKTGRLGRVVMGKAWENTRQAAVPVVPDGEPPAGVDYDMWIGPAPKRPFNVNRFHGRWRWFHDFGTGDLGNDGVHRLDMAVALLNAAAATNKLPLLGWPRTIAASGGKWYFDDAQEFPDTLQVNYEFHSGLQTRFLTYEMRLWTPYHYLGESEGAAIFGDQGYLVVGNSRWTAYRKEGEVIAKGEGDSAETMHVQDFIDCVRSRNKPRCDLETVGHPASVLCHAGNIAARVGRTLTFDAATESFVDDAEANALRGRREYRKPWLLPEI